MVMGDGGRLRQILLNLLGNAIKFTARGAVTVALTSKATKEGQAIKLSITDTGIGIAADRLEAIFDSFTQADGETSRRFGGTGLGLTISRMLAKEMGGSITVHSEIGKGSVFTLKLCLAEAPKAERCGQARPALPCPDSQSCERATEICAGQPPVGLDILVADDNRTNALIVERMLVPEGHSVRRAADGAEVVSAYALTPPDLVLMDLSMPGMSGFEALREIREIQSQSGGYCAVIALTANGFEEDRNACFDAGFDGFVTKPVAKKTLLAEIARCMAQQVGLPCEATEEAALPMRNAKLG